MNEKQYIVTDYKTLVDDWMILRGMVNVDLFLSISNFMEAQAMYCEVINILSHDEKLKQEYIFAHSLLHDIFTSQDIGKLLSEFSVDKNTISTKIPLNVQNNLYLTLHKGTKLSLPEGLEIPAILDESVSFAMHQKNQGKDFKIMSSLDMMLDFAKGVHSGVELIDLRA